MRRFSVRPPLSVRGRRFKGLRGWSGKPFHPPLTDFPIVCYVVGAAFDVVSAVAGKGHAYAREMWHGGTFLFVVGAGVSLLTLLTGLMDAWRSSEAGTQARRTINTHATIMSTVTGLVAADLAWRLVDYHSRVVAPAGLAALSGVIAALVSVGATYGGALVFEFGFNVETAGDSPVWHRSEVDVFPGQEAPPGG